MHFAALIRLSGLLGSAALGVIGGLVSTQLLIPVPGTVSVQLNMGAKVPSVSFFVIRLLWAKGPLSMITRATVQ